MTLIQERVVTIFRSTCEWRPQLSLTGGTGTLVSYNNVVLYLTGGIGTGTLVCHYNDMLYVIGGGGTGTLVAPHTGGSSSSSQSPGGSPTKGHSHSAHTSPTNTAKVRPRARSAESDAKKLVCKVILVSYSTRKLDSHAITDI